MPLEPGQKLSHYRLIEKIGEGGMGVVWKARDEKLRRDVAVKVLPPDLVQDPERRRRLLHEARAEAAVDHPYIASVFEVDESDGVVFVAMELVRGKTLRAVLEERTLSVAEALRLATEVAEGLTAAHAARVVHRDLKPENVMVRPDGHVKILDFGLAKVLQEQEELSRSKLSKAETLTQELTREGRVLGTAAYMSPEQVKGLPVDRRSDIFSFGSILYEMSVGRGPFSGDTPADVISAILRDTPDSVCERRSELPAGVGQIVERCLVKDPDGRYESAADLLQDLRDLRASLGRTVPIGGESHLTAPPRPVSATRSMSLSLPGRPSLAVLPFVNLSGDPEQDYLAAGLWTDINADLVKITGLFLVSQVSTGLYKGKSVNPQQIGRELGVSHVLEGTVRRAGDRVRITAELVRTESGESIWAERYDGELDDLFALQDEINEEIVTALDIKLLHGEGHRIVQRSIKSFRARDVYYQALAALFTFRRDDLIEARRLLAVVAEIEPDSPLSHVFSAFSHYFEANLGLSDSPAESIDKAIACARKAIELDDPTGTAHMIKGMVHLLRKQHDAALDAADKAVQDRPSCPWAYALKGALFNYAGKPAEAIEMARLAIRHTPLVPPIFPAVLATGHYLHGQHAAAEEAARDTIELAPDHLEAHVILAAALAASGRADETEPTLREIFRIKADFALDEFAESQPYKDPSVLDGLLANLRAAGLS